LGALKIGPPSRMRDVEPAATIRPGDSETPTPAAIEEVRKARLFMPARVSQCAMSADQPDARILLIAFRTARDKGTFLRRG